MHWGIIPREPMEQTSKSSTKFTVSLACFFKLLYIYVITGWRSKLFHSHFKILEWNKERMRSWNSFKSIFQDIFEFRLWTKFNEDTKNIRSAISAWISPTLGLRFSNCLCLLALFIFFLWKILRSSFCRFSFFYLLLGQLRWRGLKNILLGTPRFTILSFII